MTESTPANRRRGAQPGNKNARGNRGNPRPRPNYGNRGGKGAPTGNTYALKRPRGVHALLLEYKGNREAQEWLQANRDQLASVITDGATDAIDIAIHTPLTPESIAAQQREFELGLFINPEPQLEERVAA